MIRTLFFSQDGTIQTGLSMEEYQAYLQSGEGLLWVDFEATTPEDDLVILDQVFNFHPLAIEDALRQTNAPKIDDWESYLYIVLQTISYDQKQDDPVEIHELDLFVGKNYLVTHHDDPIQAIVHTWDLCQRDQRYIKFGSDYLLYKLCDEAVRQFMPVVTEIDDEIDRAEDEIFDQPTTETLESIFQLKRSVLKLRRAIGPQRELFNRLARDEYALIDRRVRIYFRDIYDQLVLMHEIVESVRDLVGGVLDSYLSVINNRMNDIVKTLTVITTLFMPISFLASFFGMNFFQPAYPLDIWTGRNAFIVTILLIFLTPIGMFAWMRRRGWM
jgi:magnesium transporter